ncbi:hypothetical protein TNCV_3643241 [Trichonephila clavipes]|nr:hypothetical protein TNCV_3643241 [Trichonephila clavipes]
MEFLTFSKILGMSCILLAANSYSSDEFFNKRNGSVHPTTSGNGSQMATSFAKPSVQHHLPQDCPEESFKKYGIPCSVSQSCLRTSGGNSEYVL